MERNNTTTQSENFMATNQHDNSPTTPVEAWWGFKLISQAKEKSASVLEAVKNDLSEISTAVSETFHITPNGEAERETTTVSYMKQSLSSFFGSVTDALVPQIDLNEDDLAEAILITSDDTVVLTGFARHLQRLQNEDNTYLIEPSENSDLTEKYRMWLEIVEQDQFTQQRVDKMLESSDVLREKYNRFVPSSVSHMNFFKRYLFKKALLEDDIANEKRKTKDVIQKQADPSFAVSPDVLIEKNPSTDINNSEIPSFELSEEEQAKLLEDYEREIKLREHSKAENVQISPVTNDVVKSAKQSSKTSANVQLKGKKIKNVKLHQSKSTQQQTTRGPVKNLELKNFNQDHFKKESESSTSDESWEKEFDI